jgi:uncharacterized membrane protein YqgA involved in biofilm formation
MIGTVVNAAAIAAGSVAGIVVQSRLSQRVITGIFQAIGLFTLFLGISMSLKSQQMMVMISCVVVGTVIGELINLEAAMNHWSEKLKHRIGAKNAKFSEGLITAFLLYCMGSMTILGALQEGINGSAELLFAKSILDGISSIMLAAGLGIGVAFSIIPLFIYQGGLTLLAAVAGSFIPPEIITEISAVGGILLMGMALRIMEIKDIRVMNMLPGLVLVIPAMWIAL